MKNSILALAAALCSSYAAFGQETTGPGDAPIQVVNHPAAPATQFLQNNAGWQALTNQPAALLFTDTKTKRGAVLGNVTHQDLGSGAWVQNDPSLSSTNNGWRIDGTANQILIRKSGSSQHVVTQTYTDYATKHNSVLALTLPTLTHSSGLRLNFTQSGLSWTLVFDQTGSFRIESVVAKRQGNATYSFPVSSSEPLTIDAAGEIFGNIHAGLTRAVMIPRYGKAIPCTAWSYAKSGIASFTCDDSALKANQFPYRIDPQSQLTLTDSTDSFGISAWNYFDSGGSEGGSNDAFVSFNFNSYILSGSTNIGYACGFNVDDSDMSDGDGNDDGDTVGCSLSGPVNNVTVDVGIVTNYYNGCNGSCQATYSDSATVSSVYATATWTPPPPPPTVATPTFNHGTGTYTSPPTVNITTTTSGATIRYTVDGSTPTETHGTVYSTLTVSASEIVNAIAYESGWTDSSVASAAYIITGTVAMPTFSQQAGTYTTSQSVSLSESTSGATIRYTTDQSVPTETNGSVYNNVAIPVATTLTIKALAYKSTWADSLVASATYTITPTISGLSPNSALTGTPVIITGTNLGASGTVTFNGTAATPTSWSATSITVRVPPGASSGNVIVTVSGVATNGLNFTVPLTPAITSLSISSGPFGASVTIAGSNFGLPQYGSTVTFNGAGAGFASWTNTTISAIVPAGATTGNVVVTVNTVPSNGMNFTVFTPSLSITSTHAGSFAQGQTGAAYSLTVSNAGAGPTSGTVSVYDTFPSGLTLVSMSGTGWTCSIAPACSRGDSLGVAGGAGWYSSAWAHRKPITINYPQVSGSSSLTNFPVLISLPSDPNLQAEAQASGADILFTDSTGTVKLHHEIEQYISSSGQLVAWVQIPSLSPTANTPIYMYYGNLSASNQQNAAAVWSAGYQGVWHLSGTNALSMADSTANGNTLTNAGGVTVAPAQIAGGASFSGTAGQNLVEPRNSGLQPPQLTVSCWFQTSPTWGGYQYAIDSLNDSVGFTWRLAPNDGGYYVTLGSVVFNAYSSKTFGGGMHYLTVTYDGSNVKTYIDGALDIDQAVSGSPAIQWIGNGQSIGSAASGGFPYDGLIDELRLSPAARSAPWIATEYNNQSSPGAFFTLGAEQEPAGSYPPIAATVNVASYALSPLVNSVSVRGGGSASASTDDSTIIVPTVATPTFIVVGGTYSSTQAVYIYTTTSGATVRYTTDGSAPSETAGTVYSGTAVTVAATETLKAIAYESGYMDSAVATAAYTISPVLSSVTVSPPTVISTNSATVTVTLSGLAPAGGAVVNLSGNNSAFNLPASITVLAGQTAGIATVYSGTVSASAVVTVTGTYGATQTGLVTILPLPTVTAVVVSPSPVPSGASVAVTVTLSSAAPASGAVVYFGSTNPAALSPPTSITVPGGQTTGTASVTAGTVSASAGVTVTGSYNGTSQSATTTVNPTLQITSTHLGNFSQGQRGAAYTLLVTNPATASTPAGTVGVTESIPSGLTLTSMVGLGWACSGSGCTRSDGLNAGSSYPPIVLTVNVATGASNPQVNSASVTAGAVSASATDSTTILANTMSVTSLTPSSGSGPYQTFTTVFNDPNGASNLTSLGFWVETPNAPGLNNSCQVSYSFVTSQFSLLADDGVTWNAISPGGNSSGNSQCIVVGALSGVAVNGPTATLALEIYFTAAYAGTHTLLAYAADANQNTGWNNMGNWTVGAPTLPYPQLMSSTTLNMSANTASTIPFTFTDVNGWTDMASDQISFGEPGSNPGTTGCMLTFQAHQTASPTAEWYGQVTLPNASGSVSGTVGTGGPTDSAVLNNNPNCTVYMTGAHVATPPQGSSGVGNQNLTLNLPVSFTTPYASANPVLQVYASATNWAGQTSGWLQVGTVYLSSGSSGPITTITTNPANLTINVDNGNYVSGGANFAWTPGGTHYLYAPSPQPGATAGTQYVFSNWSGGGATQSLTVTASASGGSYTANFNSVATQSTDFTLSVSSPQSIPQGTSATYQISVAPASGSSFNGTVTLSMGLITGGVSGVLNTTTISLGSPATLTLNATNTATLGTYPILVSGGTAAFSHSAVARLTVNLGSPAANATIQLGRISVQVGSATVIVPPLAAGDSLSSSGCSASLAGAGATLGTLPGNASVQTLSLSATSQVQAGATGTFSCTTTAGRIVAAIVQYADTERVELNYAPLGNGSFQIQATTAGFSEVYDVILTGSDGTNDDDSEESSGDVTAYFTTAMPPGTCVLYRVLALGDDFEDYGGGSTYADDSIEVCYEPPPPPTTYTVSGTVTSASGKPLQGITVTASINGGAVSTYTTAADGTYSVPGIVACSNATLNAFFPGPYTIPVTPNAPANGFFYCIQANQTQNFSAGAFTAVYLLHGIGQTNSSMQQLWVSLTSPGGLNMSQFYVDAGFNFGECAANQACTVVSETPTLTAAASASGVSYLGCGVASGGMKLADYVNFHYPTSTGAANPYGPATGATNIVLVGYSMGGLIARSLLTSGTTTAYEGVLTSHNVLGLVTLGTPNWGYPYLAFDQRVQCGPLDLDMAGSWNTLTGQPNSLSAAPSNFLSSLDASWATGASWAPSSSGAFWLAATGRFCTNPVRELLVPPVPPVQPLPVVLTFPTEGCLEPSPANSNDGVVCADSAEYSFFSNPGPTGKPTAVFDDPGNNYSHTSTLAGLGTFLMMGCITPSQDNQLFEPPSGDALFTKIVAAINGTVTNGH